ncbi:nucleotide sugar dehydrogenase [Desulfobacter sp.]|uniref:nucleotide sugar dehydrogenase n=1 Tax=Desulfobacter sp. TaxID=2294 RepID=UPI003D0D584F
MKGMLTFEALAAKKETIAVVGLGYVGLPLAVHLSRHFNVVGYDYNAGRIAELKKGRDRTLEVCDEDMATAAITYTDDAEVLGHCRLIIVAVPTPIDQYRIPDLTPLRSASESTGRHLSPGSCVVFESTVYPGATEEFCVPIIEETSGLTLGKDFSVGYSPERINPGDKLHTVDTILKIVSGSDPATADLLEKVYGKIVKAGIHVAPSIKVAEAAKVIENTQRDINIALMNELSMIFDIMGIDTLDVLEAAGTKWNFLPFRPGLVGGHCIGVDPYYLTFKAESIGYHPEMILAGRRVNDGMGKYIAERLVKIMIKEGKQINHTRVGVLGITFKEDVPDLRNTRVVDIIAELEDYGVEVIVHDPMADPGEARGYYGIDLKPIGAFKDVDALVVAVAHKNYRAMGLGGLAGLCSTKHPPVILDVKSVFNPKAAATQGIIYWRL